MVVIRTSEGGMGEGNRAEWSCVTSEGILRVPTQDGRFDCHYHGCHEYWLIFKGQAKVMSEGREYYVRLGDIVCTKAGDEHDVVEVYEDLEAFWLEDAPPEGGHTGHLHRDSEEAKGHPVPATATLKEFPL